MLGDAYLLQCFPGTKQEGEEMLLLWEDKVLIREIWLNIYLTEMLNSNRKWIPWLLLHLLDYF